jgi:hypothetical protein
MPVAPLPTVVSLGAYAAVNQMAKATATTM